MTQRLAGIVASLSLLLGACGTADGSAAVAETGLAGSPCRCIHEVARDGEIFGQLVPAGCVASSDSLPVCSVWHPVPGNNPPVTP